VIRPLKPPIKQLNEFVIRVISKSPYVGDAKKRHLDWEQKFEELRSRR
ncbi:MAG: aspartyl/asparaginyl beta-hydroxylase domain-containing protein, partial [Acidimicrobiia bacterium]|nr:aspartyl/asparaginyl beta-hydroxylase domain-containing protein [Acidimicrobiia bacterium]